MKLLNYRNHHGNNGQSGSRFIRSKFPDTFNLSTFMTELLLGINLTAYCITALVVSNLGDRYGRRPIINTRFTDF